MKLDPKEPAYPIVEPNTECSAALGFTKREKIAIAAMAALIAKIPAFEVEGRDGCEAASDKTLSEIRKGISASAALYADALIAELNKGEAP